MPEDQDEESKELIWNNNRSSFMVEAVVDSDIDEIR